MAVVDALTVDIKLGIDHRTALTCLKVLELYLNQNDTKCLVIENDEPGDWTLELKDWNEVNDERY